MSKLTYGSYSTLSMYESCPAAVRYTKILGLKGKQHHAAVRGDELHLKGEHFLKGDIPNVPKEFGNFKTEMTTLRKSKAAPEKFWAVDHEWNPLDSDDKKNRWLVGKTDAHLVKDTTLHIIDYKSGKVYDNHIEQGAVYACMGLGYYPEVELVNVEFFYLDIGTLGDSPFTFSLQAIGRWRKDLERRVNAMLSDTKFKATPSRNACRWCKMRSDVTLANGNPGPCDLWRKAK